MSNVNLMEASGLWASMPPEARYWTIREMHDAASAQKAASIRSAIVRFGDLRVDARGDDLMLSGKAGVSAQVGHYPAQQLAQAVSAPVSYLRTLPPTLAAQNLNHGLARLNGTERRLFLMRAEADAGPAYTLRSIDGPDYARIYNADMTERLLRLEGQGWQVPPARPTSDADPRSRIATDADVLAVSSKAGLGIKVGDRIAPSGLYLDADSNMFAFLVNDARRVSDGTAEGLARGFFLRNTEVCGIASWSLTTFLYRFVCGNHIVWDAQDVSKVSFRHVGRAADRIGATLRLTVQRLDYAASVDEARIKTAQAHILGASKDDVLDKLFGLKIATRDALGAAWDAADANHLTDGSPASAWGFAQGLTRVSQAQEYMTDRAALDAAAGKVIELAF